jgi:hypothetical protein
MNCPAAKAGYILRRTEISVPRRDSLPATLKCSVSYNVRGLSRQAVCKTVVSKDVRKLDQWCVTTSPHQNFRLLPKIVTHSTRG